VFFFFFFYLFVYKNNIGDPIITARAIGKKLFQAKSINKSYRYRGSVHRTHTQKKTNLTAIKEEKILPDPVEKNIKVIKTDIK